MSQDVVSELDLDLVCFVRPFYSHWSIELHRHLYLYLYMGTLLRWDPSLGEMFIIWRNLQAFSFSTYRRAQYDEKLWPAWSLRNNVGVLALLGYTFRGFADRAGFLKIFGGCDIDQAVLYLAYRRSGEINSESLDMKSPFLLYDIKTVIVADFAGGLPYHGRTIDGLGSAVLVGGLRL